MSRRSASLCPLRGRPRPRSNSHRRPRPCSARTPCRPTPPWDRTRYPGARRSCPIRRTPPPFAGPARCGPTRCLGRTPCRPVPPSRPIRPGPHRSSRPCQVIRLRRSRRSTREATSRGCALPGEQPRRVLSPTPVAALTLGLLLAGCAVQPVNQPLREVDPDGGYRWSGAIAQPGNDPTTLLILTFSGGGARAAAFSYGVLEELRRTELRTAGGTRRVLDEVDLITGISGGSFTALSYALYGDRLFSEYERRFLNRDVDGALIERAVDPFNWGRFRSEIAADYYDEVLFGGATYGDLMARPTPIAVVGATAISLGSRIAFVQNNFDVLCSDLRTFPLSRAAASSSAVPLILTPVTLRNYGGACGYQLPRWVDATGARGDRAWSANRVAQRYRALARLSEGKERPYLHLVDGGIADNLGLSLLIDELQEAEASAAFRAAFDIARLRHVAIVVVNAHSDPDLGWEKDPFPPPDIALLLQTVSVPIEQSSYETLYALENLIREWSLRRTAESPAGRSEGAALPPIAFTVVNVSFDELADAAEHRYFLNLPTRLSLPTQDIDRLQSAAGRILRDSPAFQKLVRVLAIEASAGATGPVR